MCRSDSACVRDRPAYRARCAVRATPSRGSSVRGIGCEPCQSAHLPTAPMRTTRIVSRVNLGAAAGSRSRCQSGRVAPWRRLARYASTRPGDTDRRPARSPVAGGAHGPVVALCRQEERGLQSAARQWCGHKVVVPAYMGQVRLGVGEVDVVGEHHRAGSQPWPQQFQYGQVQVFPAVEEDQVDRTLGALQRVQGVAPIRRQRRRGRRDARCPRRRGTWSARFRW
jgi:hypothetical protein